MALYIKIKKIETYLQAIDKEFWLDREKWNENPLKAVDAGEEKEKEFS